MYEACKQRQISLKKETHRFVVSSAQGLDWERNYKNGIYRKSSHDCWHIYESAAKENF